MLSRSLLTILLAFFPSLHAELPLPLYPKCGEPDRPDLCPPDLQESWELISYIPLNARESVRTEELEVGSGCHADEAWRYSTGRWDVTVAVIDSGFEWNAGSLVNKVRVNTAELPPPTGPDGKEVPSYDTDVNGLVNVQDWASDPRVDITAGRDAADHLLDASDLLYTAWGKEWDGIDNDSNGFVDDIAGWDFFMDDNDPWPDWEGEFGTHGTGVAESAIAEGGDTWDGDIGVCPNCSFLPVRVGDSFITDGNRVAMAIAYATDNGASVLGMAIGSLSNPEILHEALDHAHEQGVVMVTAAGDENSYHPNYPAVYGSTLVVHSVRSNNLDEGGRPYTYQNFFNCNNFGPRLFLVTTSNACATGAVAITTGAAGLLLSAARDQGIELSPEELRGLLSATADDINLSEEDLAEAHTYPSGPGWDPFFGYGKLNIGRAVEWIQQGDIPPLVDIESPDWFEWVDPADTSSLELHGRVSADHASSVTWTLEQGDGLDPRTWTTLASGSGPLDGLLGSVDPSALSEDATAAMLDAPKGETVVERAERIHRPALTLRLTATDDQGLSVDTRKTFFLERDPDLLPGFPIALGASSEGSPNLADLDGDGDLEILIAFSSGELRVYHGDGLLDVALSATADALPLASAHPSASSFTDGALDPNAREGFLSTPAIGDIDVDGIPDVVAASIEGKVYAWSEGEIKPGFPVSSLGREPEEFDTNKRRDQGFMSSPALYDLDNDGTLEIIVASLDQRLYVLDAEGRDWGPFPIDVCYEDLCDWSGRRIIANVAVGDVDGDGTIEIGLGTNETEGESEYGGKAISYLINAESGTISAGWPRITSALIPATALLPIVGEGHPSSMAFADFEGDGTFEIVDPIMLGQVDLIHPDGSVVRDLPHIADSFGVSSDVEEGSFVQMLTNPAFGDLNGDNVPELVMGGAGTFYLVSLPLSIVMDYEHVLAAWDGATGQLLSAWPRRMEDIQFLSAPAIADISGDNFAEAIASGGGFQVHAYDAWGREPESWPKYTGQWALGSPAVGDLDGDGYLDVVLTTRHGYLFAWRTQGRADQAVQWASMRHDPQNTGNYETPLASQAGPADSAGDGGCCKDGDKSDTAWILLPLLFGWRRRSSRRASTRV